MVVIVAQARGRRTGPWSFYFRNGRLKAEGTYQAGELDGEWVWHREGGGLLQQGAFVEGQQHGLWRRWHDTATSLTKDLQLRQEDR